MNSIEMYSFLKMPKLAKRFPYISCHVCVFCDRILKTINHRREIGLNERPFGIKCNLCCRSFKNKNSLGCHKRNFHSVMKSGDLIVNRAEKTAVLTKTTAKSTKQIGVKCNICFKTYGNMNSLRTHKYIYHKSIKPQVLAENSLDPSAIAQPKDSSNSIEWTQHNPPLALIALDRNEKDKGSLTVVQED